MTTTADNVIKADKAAKEAENAAAQAKIDADRTRKEAEAQTKKNVELAKKQAKDTRRRVDDEAQHRGDNEPVEPSSGDGRTVRRDKGDWAML